MAKTALLTLALVAAAAAAAAAANSPHLRLSGNSKFDAFSESTRFSPIGGSMAKWEKWTNPQKVAMGTLKDNAADVGAKAVMADAGRVKTAQADCKGIMVALAALKNPLEMRVTLDAARNYGAATIAKLAEALHAQNARVRAPMFTVIDDDVTPAAFFAPLRHDIGGNAFGDDVAVLPRVYDPRLTERPLVVVVPHARAAAFRAALHGDEMVDIALVHVVGMRPRAADDEDQPSEASFAGRGFTRHAAVTLMRALHTADNLVKRAWLFDHDTVALAHKKAVSGSHGVVTGHARWLAVETLAGNDGKWGDFVYHAPQPDTKRNLATPAAVRQAFANEVAGDTIRFGLGGGNLGHGALVNLEKLAATSYSFPTAFPKGREDDALLLLDGGVTGVTMGKVQNLVTIKAPLVRPATPLRRAEPKYAVIDASSTETLFSGKSAAEFVMEDVRAPCAETDRYAPAAALMDTAALALGDLAINCISGVDPDLQRHDGLKAYSTKTSLGGDVDVNLLEFFRPTSLAKLHVAAA